MDSGFAPQAPGGGQPAAANTVTNSSPATGQTVAYTASPVDQTLYLTPAGTLAALTITFPSDAASRLGQFVRIYTRQTITALTLNGAATIVGADSTMVANSTASYQKVAADTWMKQ